MATMQDLRTPPMPALRLVHTPRKARAFALALFLTLLALPVALALAPWQQAIAGTGRVIAYLPSERPQLVEAPIDGRVQNWYVWEGKSVKAGDKIVDLQDVDPEFLPRTRRQLEAIRQRHKAALARVDRFGGQIAGLSEARDKAVRAAEERVRASERTVEASRASVRQAEARRAFEDENYQAQRKLFEDGRGLASKLERDRAYRAFEEAKERVLQAQETLARDEAMVKVAQADVARIASADGALIEMARANREAAYAEAATAEQQAFELEIRISRQGSQEVRAPCAGMVQRLISRAGAGGELVKAGDALIEVVPVTGQNPESKGLVVELFVDGLDTPLMFDRFEAGDAERHVRLQFEGYPAIQFTGWPSVAVGTFGGKVILVDRADNGKGQFRVLVAPDPNPDFGDDAWPAEGLLRQGMRANGWVFLSRVTLGWELWRRLNGFPPVVDPAKDAAKEKVKRKVPK